MQVSGSDHLRPAGSDRSDSLERIIIDLQDGKDHEGNFRRLFELYHPVIQRFFAKRGFSSEECKDLAQEVFLKVFRNIGSYRGDGPFEGWLFQIAANIYRNRLREKQAAKRQGQEDSLDTAKDLPHSGVSSLETHRAAGPQDEILKKEKAEALAEALGDLPEQMQRCLTLRIHQGLKYREIAAVMQISIETVKAHLYQARNRLKSDLGGYFDSGAGMGR